jgi:hypothetical protein
MLVVDAPSAAPPRTREAANGAFPARPASLSLRVPLRAGHDDADRLTVDVRSLAARLSRGGRERQPQREARKGRGPGRLMAQRVASCHASVG